MRIIFFVALLLQAASYFAAGKPLPLTVKDVSLMLRSGYSVAAVSQELAARHFIDVVDEAAEKALLAAGATPQLLSELKNGGYAVPAGDLGAAQDEFAVQAKRRALQAEESRRLHQLYQMQQAQAKVSATPSAAPAPGTSIIPMLTGDLITSRNGVTTTVTDQAIEKKKLIALYYSASWCGPCRKFTPKLVDYYNRVAAAHPEFEIVFISSDRSRAAMEAYMRDYRMPWPAISFPELAEKGALKNFAGKEIPCLVVVNENGQVVSHSDRGGKEKVLADLDQIFAAPPGTQVALQR